MGQVDTIASAAPIAYVALFFLALIVTYFPPKRTLSDVSGAGSSLII